MIVLFPTHNRLEYNKLTLPVMLRALKRRKLLIIDDMSTDGTWEWLNEYPFTENVELIQKQSGNSTSQWMLGLEEDLVANFCNDVLIHSDALDYLEFQISGMTDILGISPMRGEWPGIGVPNMKLRTYNGCGVYRTEMFKKYGEVIPSTYPGEERFFGFTSYQQRIAKEYGKPCFIRDEGHIMTELDYSPWSRVKEYTQAGYSRDLTSVVLE